MHGTRHLRGFTLVELMVVVAIIGMLASAVVVNVIRNQYKAQRACVESDFQSLEKALKLYRLDLGRYPSELNALWEAPGGSRKWGGPYVEDPPPLDPWGNAYQYSYRGGSDFELVSYGADGASGGVEEDVDLSSSTIREQ